MRRFFQTAPMIYAAMSRLAAENATPYQIDLWQNNNSMLNNVHRRHDLLYDRFHHQIGLTDNAFLMPSLNVC